MQPSIPKIFLTTDELAKATAGGRGYIRTKYQKVLGLALRLDLNPGAPDEVAFGTGPVIVKNANLLLDSKAIVPAYVKRATNKWEYLGHYRATAIRCDEPAMRPYISTRKPGHLGGVLYLESASEPKVQISGGGFGDPETRKEIEKQSIAFVSKVLRNRGFQVEDRQRENRGYDLYAKSKSEKLLIEVKGTDSPEPRFFLTRNEGKCSRNEKDWRLFVVCNARSTPILHEYTAEEMHNNFAMDPLAWECVAQCSANKNL